MIELLADVDGTQSMIEEGKFTLTALKEDKGITLEDVEALYTHGKLQYECGMLLYHVHKRKVGYRQTH